MEVLVKMDFLVFAIIVIVAVTIQALLLIVAVMLLKKGGLWNLLRYRMGSGILDIVACRATKGIKFDFRKKPKKTIVTKGINELGREVESHALIKETAQHLEGTSLPINIAIDDIGETVDLFKEYKASKSDKYQNDLLKGTLLTGIMIGSAQRDDSAKSFMEKFAPLFQIIIVCGIILIIAMLWILLSNTPARGA